MPRKDRAWETLDPSTEAMLAEHERLAGLYLHNAEMGEKRVSLYLTLISAGSAVLLGVAQFRHEVTALLWPGMGFLAGLLIIGFLTFHRLIERRMRATEYLRAINRIHGYFVAHDPLLAPYFFWLPYDDVPSFRGKRAALAGLHEVVALLNSIFVGLLIVVVMLVLWPALHVAIALFLGVALAVIAWLLHQGYENRCLCGAERESTVYVQFPKSKGPACSSEAPRDPPAL